MNTLKSGALLLVLTSLFLLTGLLLGGIEGILLFLGISLIVNFFSFWYSDKMVLSMSKAKEVSPEEAPELHSIVDTQVYQAGISKPKVFIIESDTPNAFATGRSRNHSSIAVTSGITKLLTKKELGGVIAHELAHIGNQDTLIMTIVAAIAGAISMIAWITQWSLLFGGMNNRHHGGGGAIHIVGMLIVLIIMPMAALLVRLAISRTREYQADKTGAYTSGNPSDLASALGKLEQANNTQPLEINKERLEPISHLFIVNPLISNGMAKLFSTHPPMGERIRRLENIESTISI